MPLEKKITRKSAAPKVDENAELDSMLVQYLSAGAMRLAASKIEAAAKKRVEELLAEKGEVLAQRKLSIEGVTVYAKAAMTTSTMTVVDCEKLATLITPEQFMQCAKVSLASAKEVLPQQLINQCSFVSGGEPSLKITGKGVPAPQLTI